MGLRRQESVVRAGTAGDSVSYAEYHARAWAEGKPADVIQGEIAACELVLGKPGIRFPWNSAGSAQLLADRIETLQRVLEEKFPITIPDRCPDSCCDTGTHEEGAGEGKLIDMPNCICGDCLLCCE